MSVLKLTSENFEEEVLKSEKPVLVDFYADWCGPCRAMSPVMEEIAEENAETMKIGKVNVDEQQDLAMEYEAMTIPTMLLLKNGKVQRIFVGARDKAEIVNAMEELISNS